MGRRHPIGPATVGFQIGMSYWPTWIRSPYGLMPSSRCGMKWNSSASS
jgi:hypothetical protein